MAEDEIRFPFPDAPAAGAGMEVAPGILWLRMPLPMVLDHVNVLALEEGDGWTLIDTGFHSPQMVTLWERILAGPLAGRPVRRVIGTHHHPDHIGMAGWFQARGAELLMTRTAWLSARMLVLDVQQRPSPEALAFWRGAGLSPERIEARSAERPWNMADVVHPLPPGFTRLREGDVLHMAGRDWTTRIGHGHAPAHATFWSGDLVIGGDQLLPGISANIGVYPNEPGADPLGEWLESCDRLSAFARPSQLVLPGHKLPFTGLPFRLAQMRDNHLSALDRLCDALAAPMTAVDCFPLLFKRAIGPAEEGLALAEAMAHLNHLQAKGLVSREVTAEGVWIWRRAGA